jgi:hypothetical protein
MEMKMRNPREFWIDTVTAAIGSLSDEQLERGRDAILRLGSKFVLEIEHVKAIGGAFHFNRRAYVDLTDPDADRLPFGSADFTVN